MRELINIPKGYKQTKVGVFPQDWNKNKLGQISQIKTGKKDNQDKTQSGNYPFFVRSQKIEKIDSYSFDGEAILIPGEGRIGDIFHYINGKFDFHQRVYKISDFDKSVSGKFIYYYLQHFFRREVSTHSVKATVDSLRLPTFLNMTILLPSLIEQKKIAEVLGVQDQAIFKYESLLDEYLRRRNGLDQELLSGSTRFKEFIKNNEKVKTKAGLLPEEWNLKSISEIVDRVKEKLIPESETLYREIGIRSHCKGIFHKEEVTGKSLGNKSVFWIQPDCFVVNIVFAWEHAIAKTTEAEVGMIASHRFPLYKPKADILDLDYLLYYFKTARGKHLLGLASPGGAGRNKTLGQTEFAKLKIPVPSLEEQKRIVSVLSESDKEIELLKQHINTLKEQKKGLMQKLLTGQIRVKIV
ncbi:MAG: restriction endonuclease subunit S [Bacteroidota bacterium]